MKHAYYDVTLTCFSTAGVNANDVIADVQAVSNLSAGYLNSLELFQLDDTDEAIDVYFLRSNTSMGTEGSSANMTDTEALEILTKVPFTTGSYANLKTSLWQGKTKSAGDEGMGVWLQNAAPATAATVYVAAVMQTTGTFTTGGLKLRVGMEHEA